MSGIANFFTLFWIIYFPTCIAYNDLPGFNYVDEVMTGVMVLFTVSRYKHWSTNMEPWREFAVFAGILACFTIWGLTYGRNPGGVWYDFIQELRPYSIIYCTWILNPQFSQRQKHLMLGAMIVTLFSWIYYHPETTLFLETGVQEEFPVLGQMAICTGMAWYLFNEDTQKNRVLALAFVCVGLIAPKFKFMGEVVAFVALLFFIRKKLEFKSMRSIILVVALVAVVIYVTWERFDAYYIEGMMASGDDRMARPETYKTALRILWDYFPMGSGMGSFACNAAWKVYSPLYYEYHLSDVWGLSKDFGYFICDAYYPTLAQFGVVGLFFFCWYWKRRLVAFNEINEMKYYRVAMMAFFCLAMEQIADSSWLSGKGMGYCMLIGLCLNANLNAEEDEEDDEESADAEEITADDSLLPVEAEA